MATGNIFLGTARRKLGDVVLYRANGQQVSRVRVTPKNPQTEAQNTQRMVFSSLTTSASALREIVDHSFKGVEQGQRSINHFVSINSPIARALTSNDSMSPNGFLLKGVKGIALLPLQVSNGSLPPLNVEGSLLSYLGENRLTLLTSEIGTTFQNITSAQEYETALNVMGLSSGEQLTMVSIVTACNPDGEPTPIAEYGNAQNVSTWALYGRIVFKKAEDVNFGSVGINLVVNNQFNPAVIDFERSSDWVNKVSVYPSTSNIDFRMKTGGETTIGLGGTLIRSRLTSAKTGIWDFSPARLVYNVELSDTSQLARAEWVAPSYGSAAAEPTSAMYLEQANNTNAIGSDAGFRPSSDMVFIRLVSNNEGSVSGWVYSISDTFFDLSVETAVVTPGAPLTWDTSVLENARIESVAWDGNNIRIRGQFNAISANAVLKVSAGGYTSKDIAITRAQ